MFGWESVTAVLVATAGFLWSVFRDKSGDIERISTRLAKLESEVDHHSSDIARLEKGQDEFEASLQTLQTKLHSLDVKLERVLAILEKK